ncbi:MAG TPA: YbhB/YbcL family Raf kinase inhibitor-like protein [Thermoleophilaceae bacterium]|nr:YbhB/YbcL family Raf kinase inhibitor-like protein [Thermoleophilaceae bacterium]
MATGFFLVTGCGDKGLDKPLPEVTRSITISLPWRDGGRIPRRYTCDGADREPAVKIAGGAPKAFAIVMTDRDAPGGTFVHWTRWDGVEGENSFGRTGYGGPCPPKGDKPHRYVVTVYALKRKLGLARGAKPDEVVAKIRKLATARGSSTGLYGR